jgi:hypothetical protein
MDEQNRDNFYESPPPDEPERWHDNAVIGDGEINAGERAEGADLGRPLRETEDPEAGPYPLPSVVERPHSTESGLPSGALQTDPSLSRAVDRDEAGLDSAAAGYDRSIEGPTPGPLDPDAEQVPADASDKPGGQWGSSG